jgi:hypothetical protein
VSPDDLEGNRQKAKEIEQQQPGWMVLYGSYTKEYVAFPLFRAPPGTILTANYPPALITRMQQTERRLHGRPRHRGEP